MAPVLRHPVALVRWVHLGQPQRRLRPLAHPHLPPEGQSRPPEVPRLRLLQHPPQCPRRLLLLPLQHLLLPPPKCPDKCQ